MSFAYLESYCYSKNFTFSLPYIFFFHKTLKNEIHMRNKSCNTARNKVFKGKKDICEDMRRQFNKKQWLKGQPTNKTPS